MKTVEEILEVYKNADRIRRDNMWYQFTTLRSEFDDIENRNGKRCSPQFLSPEIPRKRNVIDSEKRGVRAEHV